MHCRKLYALHIFSNVPGSKRIPEWLQIKACGVCALVLIRLVSLYKYMGMRIGGNTVDIFRYQSCWSHAKSLSAMLVT